MIEREHIWGRPARTLVGGARQPPRRRVASRRALLNRPGGIGTEAPPTTPQPRVEQVPHRVAEHVQALHDNRQAQPWPERQPRRHLHELTPFPAQPSPAGNRNRQTESREAQRRGIKANPEQPALVETLAATVRWELMSEASAIGPPTPRLEEKRKRLEDALLGLHGQICWWMPEEDRQRSCAACLPMIGELAGLLTYRPVRPADPSR